ncbi:3D domain-containing protein [Clostridium lacusfryxellense]|uniref:3D domain-containing protein n=1 Tax=Clostridium lacusfryxellense TaxID=205328 RepID=UPI001C0BB499|nr:3D domain-containing protein [Clostridium lacusfryxellense]MBU3112859.1 G5 domain-containing protein [Clostridium lacusfryxellense]
MVKFITDNRRKIVAGLVAVTTITGLTVFMSFIKKDITVVVDGNPTKLVTYQKTFGSALKKSNINIDLKDTVNKSLNSKIDNNDIITINRAVNLKVFVDNKELNVKSSKKDISLLLASQNISINTFDKVSPSINSKLSSGMSITITRVKKETINQSKPVDFKTVIKKDSKILKSKTNVSQNGIKGEKTITTDITYENGKEVNRKVVKETLVKEPKNKIIVQGTMPAVTLSRGGTTKAVNVKLTSKASPNRGTITAAPNSSGKTLYVKATAYYAFNGPNNTYTASGARAVRNPSGFSTIAVDPSVIPLGTRLYVEGYGNAIAADKGSSVKGNYIDCFFDTKQEAISFGVRRLKVQILN